MLAVDNFNGAKVLGRTIRCDHCQDYHEEQAKDPATPSLNVINVAPSSPNENPNHLNS